MTAADAISGVDVVRYNACLAESQVLGYLTQDLKSEVIRGSARLLLQQLASAPAEELDHLLTEDSLDESLGSRILAQDIFGQQDDHLLLAGTWAFQEVLPPQVRTAVATHRPLCVQVWNVYTVTEDLPSLRCLAGYWQPSLDEVHDMLLMGNSQRQAEFLASAIRTWPNSLLEKSAAPIQQATEIAN